MIIVKMNDSTVECSIAASELREIGLTPESVMNADQGSIPFLNRLNREVGEQLGYDPEREVLLMSKNMMSDGSVRIFAVKMTDEDIQRAADRIRSAAQEMTALVEQEKIEGIKALPTEEKGEALGELFMNVTEQVNRIYVPEEQPKQETEPSAVMRPIADTERYTITFSSLREAVRFAKVARHYPLKRAALYRLDDSYYLLCTLKNDNDNIVYEFRKAGVEYAENLLVNAPAEQHILETGELIIPRDAVKHLCEMA